MSGYSAALLPQHAALLAASAIPAELASRRGYVSVDTKTRLAGLGEHGIVKSRRSVPGLLIPLLDAAGERWGWQYRPDEPVVGPDGKTHKYETPWRQANSLDVPPGVGPQLIDTAVPLWVTEGSRKADAAAALGLCCIAVLGVDSWLSQGAAVPAWRDVRLRGRRVIVAYDSDVTRKADVRGSLTRLAVWLDARGASVEYLVLPDPGDGGKTGLDDYIAAGHGLDDLRALVHPDPPPAAEQMELGGGSGTSSISGTQNTPSDLHGSAGSGSSASAEPLAAEDGAVLLDDVERFLSRFIAFPSEAARVAVTLWTVHTHAVDCTESTPRLALLSPEPGSGKTRTLEVLELLTPRPLRTLNASVAAIFRMIATERPTLLFDEVDSVFTKRGKDDTNEDLRGLLNAGHRRGATVPRCVGKDQQVQQFPVYAAVALAGLGDLPGTLMTRSVIVRMRRRAPHEPVEQFRERVVRPGGHELNERLAAWTAATGPALQAAWPELPEGVTDRPADVWEPLLAIADAAGGDWPKRARAACVELVAAAQSTDSGSLGIRLLADLRTAFGNEDRMATSEILTRLTELDEAPWADLHGAPLNARGLAARLRGYEIRSTKIKVGGVAVQGYRRGDLFDAWVRYVPEPTDREPRGADGDDDLVRGQGDERQQEQTDELPYPAQAEPTEPPEPTTSDPVPEVPDTPEVPEPDEPYREPVGLRCVNCHRLLPPNYVAGGWTLCPACEPGEDVA